MPEINIFNEMLKLLGVGGAFLFILYVYHKSVTKQFDTILANQNEREKETFSQMNKIIDNQAKREESNFKLLQDMVSTNLLQNAHLEKIEALITNNRWCPYVRHFLGENADEPNHTAN